MSARKRSLIAPAVPACMVQVRHRDDADAWILVHVEVQGGDTGPQATARIAHRMYRYRTRIEDRHETLSAQAGQPPPALFSLCILVASRSGPDCLEYRREFLGQSVSFSFPVVHVSQWLDRWDELESRARTNPFAVVIMAQLQALRHHGAQRVGPTLSLARLLYEYGCTRDQIRLLLRQIERRFGPVDAKTTQRIQSAQSADLETWSLRLPRLIRHPWRMGCIQMDQRAVVQPRCGVCRRPSSGSKISQAVIKI